MTLDDYLNQASHMRAELDRAAKEFFEAVERQKVEEESDRYITYPVYTRRNRMEQSSLRFIPSDRSDRDRFSDLIRRTYGTGPDLPHLCPRCGQDVRYVRHCDTSAGFRREGFVPEPVPVKMTFNTDEVIDGEVLPVDQAELEE